MTEMTEPSLMQDESFMFKQSSEAFSSVACPTQSRKHKHRTALSSNAIYAHYIYTDIFSVVKCEALLRVQYIKYSKEFCVLILNIYYRVMLQLQHGLLC